MKSVTVDVLDFKVPTLFYESVEEGDKAAGRTGAVLDECNKNLQYRGSNADARDLLVVVAAELSGLSPKTKTETKGDKQVEVSDETEAAFVARVIASGKASKESIQSEVETRATNGWKDKDGTEYGPIAVDIKARVRQAPKPPKLSAEIKGQASGFLASLDDTTITTALQQFLPDATFSRTGDSEKDIESLGWKLRDWVKAKEKAALGGFGK